MIGHNRSYVIERGAKDLEYQYIGERRQAL